MAQDAFKGALALLLLLEASCTFYTGPPAGIGNAGTPVGTPTPGTELDGGAEPSGKWQEATHNLANLKSSCGGMALVSAHPTEDFLIVSIVGRGLWASTDGAQSWYALGTGALSTIQQNIARQIAYDPADAAVFWEAGVGSSVGILNSTDAGKHLAVVGTPNPVESISIDFNDPARQTILAGGSEQIQTVYLSTDGGATFQGVGDHVPIEADVSTFPLLIDPTTFLIGCPSRIGNGATTGVYRSEDSGETWALASTLGGTAPPLVAADASIYWASPNGGGIAKSTDQGQTFEQLVGPGFLQSVTPVELPDGRLAALSLHHVVVSNDHGATWHFVTPAFPFGSSVVPNGFVYSAPEKAFFLWHSSCSSDNTVPTLVAHDAVVRFPYDYSAKGS
jgi:hypothetical protein